MRFDSIFEPICSTATADGPTKISPAASQRAHERGVLRQEAVAGMDRVRAGSLRGCDDRVHVEIARARRRRADADRLVGGPDVQRVGVGVGIDRDGADAEPRQVRMTRSAISPRLAIRTERIGRGELRNRTADTSYIR